MYVKIIVSEPFSGLLKFLRNTYIIDLNKLTSPQGHKYVDVIYDKQPLGARLGAFGRIYYFSTGEYYYSRFLSAQQYVPNMLIRFHDEYSPYKSEWIISYPRQDTGGYVIWRKPGVVELYLEKDERYDEYHMGLILTGGNAVRLFTLRKNVE